ncbi:MAG TPA: Glu/Leu/Phe/Val dehydrogenase dimerization domain-containing protein [Oligoflexia bacterium]|nr:Glu/Leu/Phe/Val dehydrogenase dimerization domain-containing protein [Oligoflexia bacterium]HMP26574.1 Glu/Leu/Phe/Val dehydrogenase dimerization domain-containing protein [Oligoflexia bacterium]
MYQSEIFKACDELVHEQIVFFNYPELKLRAIIAIHNRNLGPALGGVRIRNYSNESEALMDVLRLSEAMTWKSALAGLNLGGGKACIIGDRRALTDHKAFFAKFGECVESLSGRYITAEDIGVGTEEVKFIAEKTKYVTGVPGARGEGGDPSPYTALGVFLGLKVAAEIVFGSEDLSKRTIAIQGIGNVGMNLLKHLAESGARIIVSDPNSDLLEKARAEFKVDVVGLDEIYDQPMDIFAPCAVGQTVNPKTLARLRCKLIAGGANNQLSDSTVIPILKEKKVVYLPDFALNAGGVISVASELNSGGWNKEWVLNKVAQIPKVIGEIVSESMKTGEFSETIALRRARQRVEQKIRA